MSPEVDPVNISLSEFVGGETVYLMYVKVWDGHYALIGLRKPKGSGPFPLALLTAGNGGGGMACVRNALRNRAYIMD